MIQARCRTLCSGLALGLSLAAPAQGRDAADLLAGLRPGHPRLLVDGATWAEVAKRGRADPRLAALLRVITSDARRLLDQPVLEYRKVGRRLLAVSRAALQRTLTLSLAYRVTGEEAFARRAEAEMLGVAAFSDWNPSHFLDVAEMTAALAFGYDWLHDALRPEARATIRQAIVEKGLRPGLDPAAPHNGWQSRENNWNQVCFGGLTLGALAVAEDEPGLAQQLLARARAGIVHGLAPYAPDGVYPEGPG
ncbi:MAG TPA: heparinase, partial [Vicinamibacteria bacterium]